MAEIDEDGLLFAEVCDLLKVSLQHHHQSWLFFFCQRRILKRQQDSSFASSTALLAVGLVSQSIVNNSF